MKGINQSDGYEGYQFFDVQENLCLKRDTHLVSSRPLVYIVCPTRSESDSDARRHG